MEKQLAERHQPPSDTVLQGRLHALYEKYQHTSTEEVRWGEERSKRRREGGKQGRDRGTGQEEKGAYI